MRSALPYVAALTLAACASGPSQGRDLQMSAATPVRTLNEGPRALYIGRSEMVGNEDETLGAVVFRLRPEWLRWNPSSRTIADQPSRASVYTDGMYSGEVDVLRTIPTEVVIDARFLPPVEARNRFGSACHCAGGVILVRTRSRGA